VLAFTWRLQTASGAAAIKAALAPTLARTRPTNFHIPAERSGPRRVGRAGIDCIEAIFEFETEFGHANGVVRLVEDADGTWRAWTLLTTLEELHGYPDGRERVLSDAERFSRDFGGENWLDQRRKAATYADHDPAVLVVGGGQAGLAVAARLNALGVDTLIIDRNERIGDNWRLRYHALTLHNEVHVNHLPLMPFPPTWPVFIPKDKLANWFESYVDSLDLNFWTGTELAGGCYDPEERRWTVTLRRSDGGERVLRPRHRLSPRVSAAFRSGLRCPASTTSPERSCIPAATPAAKPGKAARSSCSAPATAATMSRRIFAPAAQRSPWSSAARPMS
jgi:putative flavoprotein involved in K+ transport